MKLVLSIVLYLASSTYGVAAEVTVRFSRTLDNIRVRADSIQVECEALGIRFTTTDSLFVVAQSTSVNQNSGGIASFKSCDLYDLRGRLLASGVSVPPGIEGQWMSEEYGPVYAVGESTLVLPHGKQVALQDIPTLTLTAWKSGYTPVVSVIPLPITDTVVDMMLDLLPWWQRIRKVDVSVSVPLAQYFYRYTSSENGGTAWSDSKPRPFTFNAWSGPERQPDMPPMWSATDSLVEYRYVQDISGNGLATEGHLTLDTVLGTVRKLAVSYGQNNLSDITRCFVTVADLPQWDTVSSGRLFLHATDSLANHSLVSAHYTRDTYQLELRPNITTYTSALSKPSETGISVTCTVWLKE